MARIDELERGLVDAHGVQVRAQLDERGREIGDPVPLAPPAGVRKPASLSDQIKQMVRRELSERAEDAGFESFEEADDFDIPDEPLDPHTPYEAVFDPPPIPVKDKKPKEIDDGDANVDEGRAEDRSGRSGKSDQVGKGKSKPKQKPDNAGSVHEGDERSGAVEGEDR